MTDCAFDVSGFGFSGVPGVIIGHNARIAWGFTNLTTDVTDLYLEKVEGDSYWRDGALVPLEERTETIRGRGRGRRRAAHPLHGQRTHPLGRQRRLRCDRRPIPSPALTGVAAAARIGPRGRVRRQPEVDGAAAGHGGGIHLRAEPRAVLRGLPRGSRAVRRAGAEPRLCRRRRQHRLPDARQAPDPRGGRRLDAAAGLGFDLRVAGLHPLRRAAVLAQSRRRLHRHRQQRRRQRRLSLPPHPRLGLRMACRAHRRPPAAEVRDGQAHGRRHARHPGRQRVRDGQGAGSGLYGRLHRPPRTGCRSRPAALVGRAEHRRIRCRGLRERAVGPARARISS